MIITSNVSWFRLKSNKKENVQENNLLTVLLYYLFQIE